MNIPSIHPEQDHHSALIKASGCMDRLEQIALWFAKRQNRDIPESLRPATVLFAADHGVCGQFSPNEPSTRERVNLAAAKHSTIADLCRQANCSLHIVDLGVKGASADPDRIEHAIVRRDGTADITKTAAMSQQEYWEAVGIGEEMANRSIAAGANLVIAGSISSGSAISTAAIMTELLGLSPEEALAATGSDPEIYANALMAVEHAKARATGTSSHDILKELGGLETAAMAGFYRAAAEHGVPILLDGVVSATAALTAVAWDVHLAGWMMASHVSTDAGHREVLEELGLEALVELKHNMDAGKMATLMASILQSAITLQQGLIRIEATSRRQP